MKSKIWTPNAQVPLPGAGYRPAQLLANASFKDILDAAEAEWTQGPAATPDEVARRCAELRRIVNLRPFWDTRLVRDYAHAKKAFLKAREEQVSPWTANCDIGALSTATNKFKIARKLIGKVNFGVKEAPPAPLRWLERDEFARLLWATRERRRASLGEGSSVPRLTWRPRKRQWEPVLEVGSARTGDVSPYVKPKTHVDWIGRLFLFLVYTGSSVRCAYRVRWTGTPDGQWSYIDLDTEIEGRVGHLFRLGPDIASKNMAGVPIALSRRLVAHLRRWRQIDAQHGYTHLLHRSQYIKNAKQQCPPDRETSYDPVAIGKVWSRAGRDGGLDLGMLSCTGVVWVLRSGLLKREGVKPFSPSRAIMRSAALMVGNRYDGFIERFRSVMPDFQKKQIEALENPAAKVR